MKKSVSWVGGSLGAGSAGGSLDQWDRAGQLAAVCIPGQECIPGLMESLTGIEHGQIVNQWQREEITQCFLLVTPVP